jgi:biopolymer transport protein ExbD
MTSLATNPTKMLRSFLLVATFVFALVLIAALTVHSQQQRQQGISVKMAVTLNATPFPEADQPDAWIVTVTRDRSLYFGVDKLSREELLDKMKQTPRHRDAMLYIKADTHAPFGALMHAVYAGRKSGFPTAVLLTASPAPPASENAVPPMGIEVRSSTTDDKGVPVVSLLHSNQGPVRLGFNGEDISWGALSNLLAESLENRSEKVVVVQAEGRIEFADVARVIDLCRSLEAQVALAHIEI